MLIDRDSDTRPDAEDNCASRPEPRARRTPTATASATPATASPTTAANDADRDGRGAEEDNCPAVANRTQTDWDGDDLGDACDSQHSG